MRKSGSGRTFRHVASWEHPNTVFSANVTAGAFATPQSRTLVIGAGVETNFTASFSVGPGENLLVCHAGIPAGSGHKLADNLASITAFADTTNNLHISAHQARLGDGTTNVLEALYSTGYEGRAKFVYFDRVNYQTITALSTQDGTLPYGPASFAGIVTTPGTGTDIGMGVVDIASLTNFNWTEEGPIHIIKWASGSAPSVGVINAALEWMWYEWALRDNFVLYPPLAGYTQ